MSNLNCAFSFKCETKNKFSKLIQNSNAYKAIQQYDIPMKKFKKNNEICSRILYQNFNYSLLSKNFCNSLKKLTQPPSLKKTKSLSKTTADLLAFCQTSQNL